MLVPICTHQQRGRAGWRSQVSCRKIWSKTRPQMSEKLLQSTGVGEWVTRCWSCKCSWITMTASLEGWESNESYGWCGNSFADILDAERMGERICCLSSSLDAKSMFAHDIRHHHSLTLCLCDITNSCTNVWDKQSSRWLQFILLNCFYVCMCNRITC